MYVDAFVMCWHERFVFCRYTNNVRKSLSANRIAPISYYKKSGLSLPLALTPSFGSSCKIVQGMCMHNYYLDKPKIGSQLLE
jgi:hypothetical protein